MLYLPVLAANIMATPQHVLRAVELDDDMDDKEHYPPLRTGSFQKQVDVLKKFHPELCQAKPSTKRIGVKTFSIADLLNSCPVLDSDDSDDDRGVLAKRSNVVPQEVFEASVQELRKMSPKLFEGKTVGPLTESESFFTHPRRPARKERKKAGRPSASSKVSAWNAVASRRQNKQVKYLPTPSSKDEDNDSTVYMGAEDSNPLCSSSDDEPTQDVPRAGGRGQQPPMTPPLRTW